METISNKMENRHNRTSRANYKVAPMVIPFRVFTFFDFTPSLEAVDSPRIKKRGANSC